MVGEFTKEQRVTIRVCDEWLREAGLPLYSELMQAKPAGVDAVPDSKEKAGALA